MNILIIGGLLGLAVVAILGAVLMGIGEDRAEKAHTVPEAPQSPPTRQMTSTMSGTLAPQAIPRPTGQLTAQLVPPGDALRKTGQLPVPNEEERLTILNGQVHEITGELRILAQKAGELELRLSNLSEVLERQQYQQADVTTPFYAPKPDSSAF